MKEIRCLAGLNHPNLIQYYYAWNECPPIGWQNEEDNKLINDRSLSILSSTKLPSIADLSPVIDFTFERSVNPPSVIEESDSSISEHSYEESSEDEEDPDSPVIYFYFVMELCQSDSLRDRIDKQIIPQNQVWSIINQILQGIEYIHSRKLIHRDLKPSNILFALDNTVRIGDFDLVSAFGEDKIENNEEVGTILYMSPEQINRQSYNQKVDIYAIGIILFELLYRFSTQMERIQALKNIRLQSPKFPSDFQSNPPIVRLRFFFN